MSIDNWAVVATLVLSGVLAYRVLVRSFLKESLATVQALSKRGESGLKQLEEVSERLTQKLHKSDADNIKYKEGFYALMSIIQDVVYVISPCGVFEIIENSHDWLGFEDEELIGEHFSKIIHPEYVEKVSRALVLPTLAGRETGDSGSPKLFDERRTRTRITRDLPVKLLRKNGDVACGEVTVCGMISSSGWYTLPTNALEKQFLGSIGIIKVEGECYGPEEKERNRGDNG